MECGCGAVFCYDLALICSFHIFVHTGCSSFAISTILSLARLDEKKFEILVYEWSPLNSITACYSVLHASNSSGSDQIMALLLETFLKVDVVRKSPDDSYYNVDHIINADAKRSRYWVAIAYMQHTQNPEGAANALVNNIMLERPIPRQGHYVGDHDRVFEEMIMGVLRKLLNVDKPSNAPQEKHTTMDLFIKSTTRLQVSNMQRDQITVTFIHKLFESPFSLGSRAVAECIDLCRRIDPSFWEHGSNDVEERLSNLAGFALALSKKASFFNTCTVLFYIYNSVEKGETWCSRWMLVEFSLAWLRNALASSEVAMIQFHSSDDSQAPYDYTSIFSESDWEYPYDGYHGKRGHVLNKPKYTAMALIALLRANVPVVERESPHLSHLCKETMALCAVLDFVLLPTSRKLDRVSELQKDLELRDEMSHLRPENLVTSLLDSNWSAKPDFFVDNRYSYNDNDLEKIPFIVSRIAIATQYHRIGEAAIICMTRNTNDFWKEFEGKSYGGPDGNAARETLQCCLLILTGAIKAKVDICQDFTNFALHLILNMNWLRACHTCCKKSPLVPMHSEKLVVSVSNVAALHEAACTWNEFRDEGGEVTVFSATVIHCLNVLRCLSRCVHGCGESDIYTKVTCHRCCFRNDKYGCEITSDEAKEERNNRSDREERARHRKKRKWQTKGSASIQSDFAELNAFIDQLHMKKASNWCKDALRRINASRDEAKKASKQPRTA